MDTHLNRDDIKWYWCSLKLWSVRTAYNFLIKLVIRITIIAIPLSKLRYKLKAERDGLDPDND